MKRDLNAFLYGADRLLEDQHFPDTYWAKVQRFTYVGDYEPTVRFGRFTYANDTTRATVYARPMAAFLHDEAMQCEAPDDGPCWCESMNDIPEDTMECWADILLLDSTPASNCTSRARDDALGLCWAHHKLIAPAAVSGEGAEAPIEEVPC